MNYFAIYFALSVAVLGHSVRSLAAWLRRRQIIRRLGCQRMPKFPCTEPLGQDFDRAVKTSFQQGTVNRTAMEMYDKVGSNTYEVHTINEQVVHTCEPRNHQTIVTKMDDWHREVRKGGHPFSGGSHILGLNGHAWKQTRDLINPLFMRAELKDVDEFQKFVDRAIALIPRDNSTIDMQPLLRKLFLDSSTEFVFGETIDSLRDTSGKAETFIATFNRASAGAGKRIRPTGIKLFLNTLLPPEKEWLAECKVVHDYIDGCIARYRSRDREVNIEKSSQQQQQQRKRYVLIDGMSDAFPDPIALRFQLLGVFSNARETAAMAMSNVLFMLARNPHVWTKLRKQALDVEEGNSISFERLDSLSYFRFAVLEAFRLHAPITRIRRIAVRDTALPLGGGPDGSSPVLIPKGTKVWLDRFPKTRDPKFWGEDVEVYRPERFEGKKLGWDFQPFSGGPRVCPANRQVVAQSSYLLYRLVREFEAIENRDPCLEFIEHALMCFESKNGCQIALRPA